MGFMAELSPGVGMPFPTLHSFFQPEPDTDNSSDTHRAHHHRRIRQLIISIGPRIWRRAPVRRRTDRVLHLADRSGTRGTDFPS